MVGRSMLQLTHFLSQRLHVRLVLCFGGVQLFTKPQDVGVSLLQQLLMFRNRCRELLFFDGVLLRGLLQFGNQFIVLRRNVLECKLATVVVRLQFTEIGFLFRCGKLMVRNDFSHPFCFGSVLGRKFGDRLFRCFDCFCRISSGL